MKHIIVILTLSILFSCHSGSNEEINSTGNGDAFRVFLKKFKTVDLPFTFRYGNVGDSLDFDKMVAVDPNAIDSVFVKADDLNGIKCYGILKDTTKFFSLIYLSGG